MSKINVSLDVKSIEEAIKKINLVKTKLKKEIPNIFVERCLKWVQNRANTYLDSISMDYEVTSDIQSKWTTEIKNGVGKLVNSSDKAVFVEFGVGKIGEKNSHPNANNQKGQNYEYNVQSDFKNPDGSWVFDAQHKQYAVDLNNGYYVMFRTENTNRAKVLTKGSPSNMFLYNATMDLISTGTHKKIWNEVLQEQL